MRLNPGEERNVKCRLVARDSRDSEAPTAGTTFVPAVTLVSGVALAVGLCETDSESAATIAVVNNTALPMELDNGDSLSEITVVDPASVISVSDALLRADVASGLTVEDRNMLNSARALEGELHSLREGEAKSKSATATGRGVEEGVSVHLGTVQQKAMRVQAASGAQNRRW